MSAYEATDLVQMIKVLLSGVDLYHLSKMATELDATGVYSHCPELNILWQFTAESGDKRPSVRTILAEYDEAFVSAVKEVLATLRRRESTLAKIVRRELTNMEEGPRAKFIKALNIGTLTSNVIPPGLADMFHQMPMTSVFKVDERFSELLLDIANEFFA